MTRYIIAIYFIGLLYSCSQNDRKEGKNKYTSSDTTAFDTSFSLAGSWLSEDYYNSINLYKSPRKAQDNSEYIFIPDSLPANATLIYNFHEGGTVSLKAIQKISWEKIKINDKTFVKINPLHEKYMILEEILFKGVYKSIDGKDVEFKNTGEVVGLDNFHYYLPMIDYFDVASDVDQVDLGSTDKNTVRFGFKFNQDALEIYKLNCLTYEEKQCVEVGFGELAYKLWKVK